MPTVTTAQPAAGHSHDHGHGTPDHVHEQSDSEHGRPREQRGQLGLGPPMLDIGGEIGALILYTPADLEGQEIEVSPVGDPDRRTHTEVHKRTVDGRTFWAGVYAQLAEGDYQIWYDDSSVEKSFSITGGMVAELDWR